MKRVRYLIRQLFAFSAGAMLLGALAIEAQAQLPGRDVSVTTIAGAFAGYVDGDNTVSQFDHPAGMAIGPDGRLYIADRANNRVRVLTAGPNLVETHLGLGGRAARLNAPVDLSYDAGGNLYVLNFGSGTVERFNRFGNAGPDPFIAGLFQPRALTIGAGFLWVGEGNGSVTPYDSNGVPFIGFSIPGPVSGLAFINRDTIVVSDSANHVLWKLNLLEDDQPTILAGRQGVAGYQEGIGDLARFNTPQHIAAAPGGNVVVADFGNHRVRVVTCDGNTFTLYGVSPSDWVGGGFPPEEYLGWRDGTALEAESRQPFGVIVDTNGIVLTTEHFYHIVREVGGYDFPTNACADVPDLPGQGGGTNILVTPVLSVPSGYFPAGVTVEIANPQDFAPGTRFYYTLNGTDPTTNSPSVRIVNGRALIRITNPATDLSSLRVLAVNEDGRSIVVSGIRRQFQDEIAGEVGVPPSLNGQWMGGQGATVILPVVAHVREGVALRSLGYIAEVTPLDNDVPVVSVQALPMGGAQRIPIITASTNAPSAQTMTRVGNAVRLAVSYSATAQNFSVSDFGVVGMLAIQLPGNVPEDRRYRVRFGGLSGGTIDSPVELEPMGEQIIRVRNIPYLVADSAPFYWYNAGDFGDGKIDNNDVDALLFAVLRLRVPYSQSDLFDTMDTFFADTPPTAGGNRQLLFSDWETAFQRYADLDLSDYLRFWSEGSRRSSGTNVSTFPLIGFASGPSNPEVVWSRDATLSVGPAQGANAGATAQIPVFITARSGVSGLLFSVKVTGRGNAPALSQSLSFVPANSAPAPGLLGNGAPDSPQKNYLYVGWSSGTFAPPAEGKVLLGYVNVPLAANAHGGSYDVAFDYTGGAALHSSGAISELTFQGVRGEFVVGAQTQPASALIADDWKAHFFGSVQAADAAAEADPDEDGFSNYEEFLAGLNPRARNARGQLQGGQFVVRWGGEFGRSYEVQRSNDLKMWTPVSPRLEGRNSLLEFSEGANASGPGQFYRVVRIPSAQ